MPSRAPFQADTATPAGRRARGATASSASGGVQSLTRGLTLLEKLAETKAVSR